MVDFMDFISMPQVQRKPWMDSVHMELVTVDTLPRVIGECLDSGRYALDLETQGLDNRVFNGRTEHGIVGVCLAPDINHGYYIPLAHQEGEEHNLPMSEFDPQFRKLLDSEAVAVFHNAKFDQEFLEFNGGKPWGNWNKIGGWDCTLIQCYILNSREIDKRLKVLSKKYLDMEMIQLKELFPENHRGGYDFSLLDPGWEPVVWYGCSDAICTLRLDDLYHPQISPEEGLNLGLIYQIEKRCILATRWMERNRLKIDRPLVAELIEQGQREYLEAMEEVYEGASKILGRDISPPYFKKLLEKASFDKPDLGETLIDQINRFQDQEKSFKQDSDREGPVYDIKSQKQLGQMFVELNVPGLTMTEKSGQVKTARDELDRVLEEAESDFPFLKKIIRFRELEKALSTYLFPLYQDADPKTETLRIDYNGLETDTGRFSTPGRSLKKKGGGLQGGTRYFLQGTPATYDPKRPMCMQRIRECFISREITDEATRAAIRQILIDGGYDPDNPLYYRKFFVAIDYAGVELRLVTNFSKEPKWIKEFFRCSDCGYEFDRASRPPPFCPNCNSDHIGDLHTLSGVTFYGESAKERDDWKQLRKQSKQSNFALCYGGGGRAVQRSIGGNISEGWRIKNKFDDTYITLKRWWDLQHQLAKKNGYVLTGFKRKYPLPDINHEDGYFRSKAERNATNGPIQGTSADMTKIAMGLIYTECRKRGWLDKVMMNITMHDELCFEIDPDILEEALLVIEDIMTNNKFINRKKWPVPYRVDIEMGYDWTVKWNFTKIRHGMEPCPESLRPFIKNLPDQSKFKEGEPNITTVHGMYPQPEDMDAGFEPEGIMYQLKEPLSRPMVLSLFHILIESHDPAGEVLDLLADDGESLSPHLPEPIRVNPDRFKELVKEYDL